MIHPKLLLSYKISILTFSKFSRLTIVGTGNVAWILGHALKQAGHNICEVYGRDKSKTTQLALSLGAYAVDSINNVSTDSDFYVLAVSDDAIPLIVNELPLVSGMVVHTSATVELQVLRIRFVKCGVLYPLQTLSRSRKTKLSDVPLLLEAADQGQLNRLSELALSVSSRIIYANTETRVKYHLAAVFACNFVNHMYTIASSYLSDQGLQAALLEPLLRETTDKALEHGAFNSQTGPAFRGDQQTMKKHLDMLQKLPEEQKLYEQISLLIQNFHNNSK